MSLQNTQIVLGNVRCDVVIATKYGATLHQVTNDRIHFSSPVLTTQTNDIKTRPLSKNGLLRNSLQTR